MSIDYDPAVLTFEDLLALFWAEHDPRRNRPSRQYINAVFHRDEGQKGIAERSLVRLAAERGIAEERIETLLLPARAVTYAEEYHQKYMLTRHHRLRQFLSETYPGAKALADSTVATKLNAWLDTGFPGAPGDLRDVLAAFDLPDPVHGEVLRALHRP